MATSYTTLGLAKPGAGELSGTWGTTINNELTDLVNEAVSGYVSVAMSDADYTTFSSDGFTNGASANARNAAIKMTGTLTGNKNVQVPAVEKVYIFINGTGGGFAITVKTPSGSGIAIPNGKAALLLCDGVNVVEALTNITSNATMGGTLGVTGATSLAATTVSTTLGVTGNVTVNTDKLVVTASSGDTTSAGTVKGVNFTGSPTVVVNSSGAINGATMKTHIGKRIISTATSATTYTLPDAASTGVAAGSTWVIVNADPNDAVDITIQAANDDVLALCSGSAYSAGSANGTRTIVHGGVAEIVCVAANLYVIFGGGVS
tara:strand:+ start:2338 stop:3294 length:957 start_codon:yes stop_codon:yes gene_type:complete